MARGDFRRGSAPSVKAVAPYRFVPLSSRVVFPEWADEVSHDVPLQDGICGTIHLEAVAESPILVGGGEGRDEQRVKRFAHYGDDTAIPGSSFRGMLRAVLEIATFSKFGTYVDDRHFSIRDLHNAPVYVRHMTERGEGGGFRAKSEAAWLEVDGQSGAWRLVPCNLARVKIESLEDYARSAGSGQHVDLSSRQRAWRKYTAWSRAGLDLELSFDFTGETQQDDGLVYDAASSIGQGNAQGRLVLTGQPNHRSQRNAKKKEFVFYGPREEDVLEVPAGLRVAFEQVHSIGERHGLPTPNEDWEFHRRALNEGQRVPVFFIRNRNGSLRAFGLAGMFRLPYKLSTKQAVANTSLDHSDATRLDFAEALFGRVGANRKERSLRGRVSCEPLWARDPRLSPVGIPTLLGAPKPSFYPYYVAQPEAKRSSEGGLRVPLAGVSGRSRPTPNYKTLMDEDAELAGWKRYPVRAPQAVRPWPPNLENQKISSTLWPLLPGSRFEGTIHVHNLKPEELGALVWALTWGGKQSLRHAIGMGKPFGYGQIRVAISNTELEDMSGNPVNPLDARKVFEDYMETESGLKAWRTSEQLNTLLSLADPSASDGVELRHPRLDRPNEFIAIRRQGSVLDPLRVIDGPRDRVLYPRLTPEEREAKARQRAEAQDRQVAEEERSQEAARVGALTPAKRFLEATQGESDLGKTWEAFLSEVKLCDEDQERKELAKAGHAHPTLSQGIAGWRGRAETTPEPDTPAFAALKPKKQKQARKLFKRLEVLRELG
jgi:CRISPR-associated protein (TIGR03986 family)